MGGGLEELKELKGCIGWRGGGVFISQFLPDEALGSASLTGGCRNDLVECSIHRKNSLEFSGLFFLRS